MEARVRGGACEENGEDRTIKGKRGWRRRERPQREKMIEGQNGQRVEKEFAFFFFLFLLLCDSPKTNITSSNFYLKFEFKKARKRKGESRARNL